MKQKQKKNMQEKEKTKYGGDRQLWEQVFPSRTASVGRLLLCWRQSVSGSLEHWPGKANPPNASILLSRANDANAKPHVQVSKFISMDNRDDSNSYYGINVVSSKESLTLEVYVRKKQMLIWYVFVAASKMRLTPEVKSYHSYVN